MKRRIATFESFKYNEHLEHGKPEVRIYDHDQHMEFCEYLGMLEESHEVMVMWDLKDPRYWNMYVKPGKMFAVVVTDSTDMSKHFIGAVLDEEGKVELAHYNDDSVCPVDIAQEYVDGMELIYKENNSWEYEEESEVCSNCGCECDKCECDKCDCSGDWKETDDMQLEYYTFDVNLADDLVRAVKSNNIKEAEALVESGADISYRRYLAIKKAIENKNTKMLEMLFSELDEEEIESDDAEELLETCQIHGVPSSLHQMVESRVSGSVINERKKAATTSYKKSGLKNPAKADLNKDKKISGYEKARGKAIQKSVQSEKEEKGHKGLTAAQKKLPEGLRKAIEKKMKKK